MARACSGSGNVSGTPLPIASTYLRVNYTSATDPRQPYRLYSVVQTGTATAEFEPNEHPLIASAAPNNYFFGEVAATTDIDVYAFEARQGDLVYLSLDSQPSRAGNVPTGDHTLQLLDRNVETPTDGCLPTARPLVAVNDFATTVNNTVPGTPALTSATPLGPSEALVYRVRTTGTYFARVGRASSTGTGQYLLSIAKNCAAGGGASRRLRCSRLAPPAGPCRATQP